jgi:NAD-dependent dihydropyrimidine dehydrogenase PreA subunit
MFAGPWNWKRFKSFFFLALAFFRRQARRLVRGGADDGGLTRFLANYEPDGLTPLTTAHEALIAATGRCIFCGLCEAACPLPLDRWPAYSRALAMSDAAAADVPPACPPGCHECADVCPTHVPLTEIPAFIHRNG